MTPTLTADADDAPDTNVGLSNWTFVVQARCRTHPDANTELFFSLAPTDISAAKQICVGCPVLADCLTGAIERGEHSGVWGGQLFAHGQILRTKRGRGRPPKHPQPDQTIIPVPSHLQSAVDQIAVHQSA